MEWCYWKEEDNDDDNDNCDADADDDDAYIHCGNIYPCQAYKPVPLISTEPLCIFAKFKLALQAETYKVIEFAVGQYWKWTQWIYITQSEVWLCMIRINSVCFDSAEIRFPLLKQGCCYWCWYRFPICNTWASFDLLLDLKLKLLNISLQIFFDYHHSQ